MKTNRRIVGKTIIVLSFCLLFITATISTSAQVRTKPTKPKVQTARVLITENGYSRTSIVLRRSVPTRITFLRQTDATCAKEIVLSEYGISRPLPLNTAVTVSFTPKSSGEFSFACGMNMHRGKLIVR
ncbi:MAG TPA: cupredoxin domain-containing protein [Pyrinomonadaceae bacterium]|nr:cupredoxin domain-containing protein [Pyrinomonadaceae bacterium]